MRIYCHNVLLLALCSVAMTCLADDASMQAAVVSGGRIRLQSVSRPVAGAHQIVVKLAYAGVNPADWKRASGAPEDAGIGHPASGHVLIPGLDGSGTVASVGRAARGFKVGDAVLLWSRHGGTYAQYVAVPDSDAIAIPSKLSLAQAAGLPHAALAAWDLIHDIARVHSGQSVLVLGGAGGVGSAAVQIARNLGARVTATASARNLEYLRQLGATSVIDYGQTHFEEQLRNIDVAVNAVDTDNAYRALSVLRRGGFLVSVAGLPASGQCASRDVACAGRSVPGAPVGPALTQIADWAQGGQFSVNVDRTFELRDVLQAWAYSQAGHTRGKIVLRVAP